MIYGYDINYLKITNNIPAQFIRYLLCYMKQETTNINIYMLFLYGTRYDQHNYFWYYKRLIIDPIHFGSIIKNTTYAYKSPLHKLT